MSFLFVRAVWFVVIVLVVFLAPAVAQGRVSVYGQDYDYLESLAQQITENAQPPETLDAYKALRPELREQCLDILGLKPLPEKTPLNIEWLGEPVDLGPCTLRKLTFYSAPEVLTPCYLFLPAEADGPVPVILYVCGSAGQRAYLHHSIMYASSGIASLALPQRPQNGPIFGEKYHWYSTGHHPCGVMTWDAVRAVDFLETMPDVIDSDRIGITGRSSGSYKSWWAGAVEPRIRAALPSQGANTAAGMVSSLRHNIKGDHTVFANSYLRDYQEYWGLRAPRELLHQHGRHDGMNRDAPTVMEYITGVYALYDAEENVAYQEFVQGHDDTVLLRRHSYEFFNRELRGGAGPDFEDVTPDEAKALLEGVNLNLPSLRGWDAEKGRGFSRIDFEAAFARPTPEWRVEDEADFAEFKASLTDALRTKVLRQVYERERNAAFDADAGVLTLMEGALQRRMAFYPHGSGRAPVVLMLHLPEGEGFPGPGVEDAKSAAAEAGYSLAVLEPAGGGSPAHVRQRYAEKWASREGRVYEDIWDYPNTHRMAAVAGHTLCSMRIQDALAAVEALRAQGGVDPDRIYVWGKGPLAVPALYAAAVDERTAGVLLEEAPETHAKDEAAQTGLLQVRVHADLPHAGGLIYPRTLTLIREEMGGWEWTAELYEALGRASAFRRLRPADGAVTKALIGLAR